MATDAGFRHPRPPAEVQAVFLGLGSDGTVSANKSSVKIIGEHTDLWAQGNFVYDSKTSGSVTVSHCSLELNLCHVAADPTRTPTWRPATSSSSPSLRNAVRIPLAVKLSPYCSAMANLRRRVVDTGADGLVLFNRFCQPDLDLDTLDVVVRLELSEP